MPSAVWFITRERLRFWDRTGNAATVLVARLADLLGETEAKHFDVLLALITALRATVTMARGE